MESYITKAGTLVIPQIEESKNVNERLEIIDSYCIKHNKDPKKVTGVKNWGTYIAIHF